RRRGRRAGPESGDVVGQPWLGPCLVSLRRAGDGRGRRMPRGSTAVVYSRARSGPVTRETAGTGIPSRARVGAMNEETVPSNHGKSLRRPGAFGRGHGVAQ